MTYDDVYCSKCLILKNLRIKCIKKQVKSLNVIKFVFFLEVSDGLLLCVFFATLYHILYI